MPAKVRQNDTFARADIDAGRVSVLTPIGVALIGLKAGSRFQWETRGGESRNLTVLAVVPGNIPA